MHAVCLLPSFGFAQLRAATGHYSQLRLIKLPVALMTPSSAADQSERSELWAVRLQRLVSVHYSVGGSMSALFTTSATVCLVIPLFIQYSDTSQTESSLVPLLALHEKQHLAMFSFVIIRASLTMCSQVGMNLRDLLSPPNVTPQ